MDLNHLSQSAASNQKTAFTNKSTIDSLNGMSKYDENIEITPLKLRKNKTKDSKYYENTEQDNEDSIIKKRLK